MRKNVCVILMLIFSFSAVYAVVEKIPVGKEDLLIQGFSRKIVGKDITFNSHLPYAKDAMIVRTLGGDQQMEWESDVLPADLKSKYVNLVWISGVSGLMHGKVIAPITLYANGKKVATFNTAGSKEWDVKGSNGSQLSFREYMRDGSEDRFGFMFLRLPRSMVTPGKPVSLKFVASNSGTDSWTMVFKTSVQQSAMSALCTPVQLKKTGKQIVKVSYSHFGAPQAATVKVGGKEQKETIVFGQNIMNVSVDPVTEKASLPVTIEMQGQKMADCTVEMIPLSRHL